MKHVAVIGGGLSGLITAIQLARADVPVQLFEKKKYPFHRVCGEYISNETIPFLKSLNLFPSDLGPSSISKFQLTSVNGKTAALPLDLGGFGISRYNFDHWLSLIAKEEGVNIIEQTEITNVTFEEDHFVVSSKDQSFKSDVVVGAFGKRSKMDMTLKRAFVKKRSPYIGVKYHINYDHPKDVIALHNFKDGYCGISRVEDGVTNLCYLSHRNNLRQVGDIRQMEENVLFENPYLKDIFQNAKFLFDQPETINEISFETKYPVENHILMCGDSAGMITPLCGNGMAMAIHASKLLSEDLIPFCKKGTFSRAQLEQSYSKKWTTAFAMRLWAGRQIQNLFGSPTASNVAVFLASKAKPIAKYLMSKTHGAPF